MQFLKRAFEVWPYVFIAVAVAGFVYVTIAGGR
jgi:hypothetical protein